MRLGKRNTGMAQTEQFLHLELVKPLSLRGGEEPLPGGHLLGPHGGSRCHHATEVSPQPTQPFSGS